MLPDSFWERVNKHGPDGCWIWEGSLDRDGYGAFTVSVPGPERKTKTWRAHRASYAELVEDQPMPLDHLCRNRACVNPAHLEPVTNAENLRRGQCLTMNLRNAWAKVRAQTHCKRGHELSGSNLSITTTGGRRCLERQRQRQRKHAA